MSRSRSNRHLHDKGGFYKYIGESNKFYKHLSNRRFRRINKVKVKLGLDPIYNLNEVYCSGYFQDERFRHYIHYVPRGNEVHEYLCPRTLQDFLKLNRK